MKKKKTRNYVIGIHFEGTTFYFRHTRTHGTQGTTSVANNITF